MNKIYDVAIIGAGPGGSKAAIDCAANGLETIILEKKRAAGRPVHCGECLSSFAVKNTGLSLTEDIISTRVKGVRVIFPDRSAKKYHESGYVLNKDKFEQRLVGIACQNGAKLRLNTRVVNLSRHKNRWVLVTDSGEKVISKIIIDASGVLSVANRLLKLTKPFSSISGIQYQIEGISTDGFLDFYMWPKVSAQGYLWVIPKNNNTSNVGLISIDHKNIRQRLDEFIQINGFKIIRIKKIFGGRLPASGPLAETFFEGLMIIGDAAGFTSPFFEGGIHLALKSGFIAASIALEAVRQSDFSKKMFFQYQREWEKTFPDYKMLLGGKRAYINFSDYELNMLAKFIPEEIYSVSKHQKIKTGLRIMFQHPALLIKGGAQMLKAFEYSKAQYYGW